MVSSGLGSSWLTCQLIVFSFLGMRLVATAQVQPDFKVGEDLVARYKDAEFMTSLGPCKVKTVKGASIK